MRGGGSETAVGEGSEMAVGDMGSNATVPLSAASSSRGRFMLCDATSFLLLFFTEL